MGAARVGRAAPQGRALGVVLRAWGHVSERVLGLCNQAESLVLLRFFVITLVHSLQLKCVLPSL